MSGTSPFVCARRPCARAHAVAAAHRCGAAGLRAAASSRARGCTRRSQRPHSRSRPCRSRIAARSGWLNAEDRAGTRSFAKGRRSRIAPQGRARNPLLEPAGTVALGRRAPGPSGGRSLPDGRRLLSRDCRREHRVQRRWRWQSPSLHVRCGPRAASRRAFRHPAALPAEPLGVEVLAAVKHARGRVGRLHEWDARLEASAIAVLAYLWRRGRGEKWAGCNGSARYGCSLAQLVIGLAPIMGWRGIPDRGDEQAVARFVKRHRKSVQRWLDWLAARRPRVAHPAAGRGGVLVAHDHRAAPSPAATSRAAARGGRQARRLDSARAAQRRPRPQRGTSPPSCAGRGSQRRRDAPEASPAAASWRATLSVSGCVRRWPTALLTRLRHM